jgi:thiamine biosynthesis protein ThiS
MNVLKINGTEKTFDSELPDTLAALLEQLSVNAETVVAEVDGRIIERSGFDKTELHSGQAIELVRFVPGG